MLMAATGPARADAPGAELEIRLERQRSAKGWIRICLTQEARYFPDCGADPGAIKRSVPANVPGPLLLSGIVPGRYALSLIHDENGNEKLDTALGIPREGFGFSRNPAIGFGPPRFNEVLFSIERGRTIQSIRLRYFL
jgi:uncharacterized protein (DUF2141 family)